MVQMHAATKGSTIGLGSILVGTMIHFDEFNIILKLLVLIMTFFLTAPVEAQAIACAAYKADAGLRGSLFVDDLARHQSPETAHDTSLAD